MGNCTYHYFGAYLEVQLKQHSVDDSTFICDEGHIRTRWDTSLFCSGCGNSFIVKPATKMEFPQRIDDIIGEDTWEQFERTANDITPSKYRYNEGKMIFIAPEVESWHNIDSDDYDFQTVTLEFPTPDMIRAMKLETKRQLSKLIDLLAPSPFVKSISIKAGYVLNEEY